MIVFSCFVPHPPLIISEIGKENLDKLSKTLKSYKYLEQELYNSKPDIIIIISPHSKINEDAFTINQQPELKVDFKEFGDLVTNKIFYNEYSLGYRIKESSETSLPIILTSEEILDYGSSIPLLKLTEHLPNIKILSIGYNGLNNKEYIKFGEAVKEEINKSGKRIAVVASGDLSHRLHKDSPNGYSARAQEFDQTIIKLINNNKIEEIINFNKELLEESGECGYRSLLILLGIIKNLNYKVEKLSYESPFGIGYLVENFKIK